MQLTVEILTKVSASGTVKGKLMDLYGRDFRTIDRYIKDNDILLTAFGALKIYKEEWQMEYENMVEERKEVVKP
jgi:hypothetical protein